MILVPIPSCGFQLPDRKVDAYSSLPCRRHVVVVVSLTSAGRSNAKDVTSNRLLSLGAIEFFLALCEHNGFLPSLFVEFKQKK